jgi:hypothetical protein
MFIMQESNKIRNSNVPMQMHCRFAPQTCTPSRLAQRLFGKFAAAKSAPNPNPPHSLFTASENKDNEK